VLVTVNGAVPTATLDVNVLAITPPAVKRFDPVTFPVAVIVVPAAIVVLAFNIVADKLPVAALKPKLAFAASALLAVELPLTNTGKKVPVVCTVVTPKSLTLE
jgi:hypothetical protein